MNEEIGTALRTEVRMYPEIAVREIVANMLIHPAICLIGLNQLSPDHITEDLSPTDLLTRKNDLIL